MTHPGDVDDTDGAESALDRSRTVDHRAVTAGARRSRRSRLRLREERRARIELDGRRRLRSQPDVARASSRGAPRRATAASRAGRARAPPRSHAARRKVSGLLADERELEVRSRGPRLDVSRRLGSLAASRDRRLDGRSAPPSSRSARSGTAWARSGSSAPTRAAATERRARRRIGQPTSHRLETAERRAYGSVAGRVTSASAATRDDAHGRQLPDPVDAGRDRVGDEDGGQRRERDSSSPVGRAHGSHRRRSRRRRARRASRKPDEAELAEHLEVERVRVSEEVA